MARTLDVSRANVWYALKAVAETGMTLFRVRGRGYRLAEPIDWLRRDEVMRLLGAKSAIFDIEIVDSADSTSDLLLRSPQNDATTGTVIAAEWQRKGRGRLGRPWHSGLGAAITFSLRWRFPQGAGSLAGLSLAVSVAVVRALARAGISDVRVKWPNDILWRHRKIAGILVEVTGDALGPTIAIMGVGINVKLDERVKSEIDQAACDAIEAGCTAGRSELLACTLLELAQILPQFSKRGFAPFAAEWQQHHAYHEKEVTLRMPGGSHISGKIAGIADDGSLVLRTRGGVRRFYGGEISLRPA